MQAERLQRKVQLYYATNTTQEERMSISFTKEGGKGMGKIEWIIYVPDM